MPVCLSPFYRLSVGHFIVGRAEMISPTSAISHSYLITKGSAKNEHSRVSRKKARMQTAFYVHYGNVFISAWLKIVSDKSESHKFWKTHKKQAKKSIAAFLNLTPCLPSYWLLLPASTICSYLSAFSSIKVTTKIREEWGGEAVKYREDLQHCFLLGGIKRGQWGNTQHKILLLS